MIDCHCHLQDQVFNQSIDSIISQGVALGIDRWVVNGTKESDWQQVAELAQKHPDHIVPSFGYHPWYINERSDSWLNKLKQYLRAFPQAGVGEIGLDRWIEGHDIEVQKHVFIQQWQLADELDRTLSVHCLRAWGALVECLPELKSRPYLLHSYSGSKDLIPVFTKHGAYFSVSGYFFDPKKSRKLAVFNEVPSDRILLETDAPAMPLPESMRKFGDQSYNHPCNLSEIYQLYSKYTNQSTGVTEEQTQRNYLAWQA